MLSIIPINFAASFNSSDKTSTSSTRDVIKEGKKLKTGFRPGQTLIESSCILLFSILHSAGKAPRVSVVNALLGCHDLALSC